VNELATGKEMEELIGRAVTDPEFRAKLIEDPEKAIKEAGYDYELTEEQLAGLKTIDPEASSEELEERLSKYRGPRPLF
jgi:hypothetical protein